jgi:hypothetical protein
MAQDLDRNGLDPIRCRIRLGIGPKLVLEAQVGKAMAI